MSEELIIIFACTHCAQGAANTAGVGRMHYDSRVRIIRVPCAGRIGLLQIAEAIDNGATSVAVLGCCLGACHYVDGNLIQLRRIKLMKSFLKEMGYNIKLVNQYTARAAEGETFTGDVEDIVIKIDEAKKEGGMF